MPYHFLSGGQTHVHSRSQGIIDSSLPRMVVFPIVTEYEVNKMHLIHEYENFIVKTKSDTSTIDPLEVK